MATYFVIAGLVLVTTIVASVFGMRKAWDDDNDTLLTLFSLVLLVLLSLSVVFLTFSRDALASQAKARVINSALGTEFSAEEVFWAGGDISKLYYGDLRRFNVNIDEDSVGDVLK